MGTEFRKRASVQEELLLAAPTTTELLRAHGRECAAPSRLPEYPTAFRSPAHSAELAAVALVEGLLEKAADSAASHLAPGRGGLGQAKKRCEIPAGWEPGRFGTACRGIVRLELLGVGSLQKHPKPTSGFTGYLCILGSQDTPGGPVQELGLCHTVKVCKGAVGLLASGPAAGALSSLKRKRLAIVPLVRMQFEASTLQGLEEFAALEAPSTATALQAYLNPALNPFPAAETLHRTAAAVAASTAPGSFNPEQLKALALSDATPRGFVAIQGPPGTGKSHLIVNGLIPRLLAQPGNPRVLVLCNSNPAVDQVLDKLERQQPHLVPLCGRMGHFDNVKQSVKGLYSNNSGELKSKRAVFSTLYHAGKAEKLEGDKGKLLGFDAWVVDEASQVQDSALQLCFVRAGGKVGKVLLVGDHQQLPPIVGDRLRKAGYGSSALERIVGGPEASSTSASASASTSTKSCSSSTSKSSKNAATHVMLKEQHRMAPSIRALVSNLSYGGELRDASGIRALLSRPLLALDLKYGECRYVPEHTSFRNNEEASAVREVHKAISQSLESGVLREPLGGSPGGGAVAVLTSHISQKLRLRSLICGMSDVEVEERETGVSTTTSSYPSSSALSGSNKDEQERLMETINTVDAFQGSEWGVAILSPVGLRRASDKNLMTVGLSRARHLLVIVGNLSELERQSGLWGGVMGHVRREGLVREVPEASVLQDAVQGLLRDAVAAAPAPAPTAVKQEEAKEEAVKEEEGLSLGVDDGVQVKKEEQEGAKEEEEEEERPAETAERQGIISGEDGNQVASLCTPVKVEGPPPRRSKRHRGS